MTLTGDATFGSGGSEPYAMALRAPRTGTLLLQETAAARTAVLDVAKWNASADVVDLTLLAGVTGPVLDIGCGPGRMVRAAADLGMRALGIDVSAAAVERARSLGTRVIEASVFDTLPLEGEWQTVLLVDGNVGIGGSVSALLERCASLVRAGGEIVVEVDDDAMLLRTFEATVVDDRGRESEPFPWAQIGAQRLSEIATLTGLVARQSWTLGDRSFCRLATTR